ncbi:WXG100 family type VII secretion target [Mycobacterium shimoidei]|uniref:WXG100 family type VII secretion target n=1 Tax=Mycobacterium shimoidei TaxID=29313 RepID=UPI0008486A68|nr:WXG100 family type VII secretion target [Mycobacterium shimoidei]MCV7259936.1 WXG100 family type VII secretion target [Mycobacterium shimoidei]ODR15022.1 hypothetical protein BHQ16_03025 [Mycobacterium shimoidei]ORW79187.1 hypothetical protein AWC26_16440 [Mycobacterium shimoidei]
MAQTMTTDTPALVNAARDFERTAGEIVGVIARVRQAAGEFDSHWQGAAAKAAQGALAQFNVPIPKLPKS